jgi:hypothetical protein
MRLISCFSRFSLCYLRSPRNHAHSAGAAATAGRLEPSRPRSLHGWLLELTPAHFFRHQENVRLANYARRLAQDLPRRRSRDGEAGIFRFEDRGTCIRRGFCSRQLEAAHARGQDAAPINHSVSAISGRMEDRARPYFAGRVRCSISNETRWGFPVSSQRLPRWFPSPGDGRNADAVFCRCWFLESALALTSSLLLVPVFHPATRR